MRDEELDELLEPLRRAEPGEIAVARWRGAVRRATRARRWAAYGAVAVASYLLGVLSVGWLRPASESPASATIEYVYAKSE